MQAKMPSGRSSARQEDERNLDMLARKMHDVWSGHLPPDVLTTGNKVRGNGILSIRNKSSLLANALSGRRLTDLGAGNPQSMAQFAKNYGCSEYVALDSFRDYSDAVPPEGAVLVNDDMLRHLFRQPDGSTNIVMNAIDGIVLYNPDHVIESSYSELLAIQIARVVPPGGIAFGFLSPVLDTLTRHGFHRLARTDAGPLLEMESLCIKPLRQI